jgi:ATP-dependent Clp protease ATP-binding subunit ClpA
MLFEANRFDPERIADERTRKVVWAAIDRAPGPIRPSDLVSAAIGSDDAKILAILVQAMPAGGSPADLSQTIEVYNPRRSSPSDFDGSRSSISAEALAALEEFDRALLAGGEGILRVALELLLSYVLRHLDRDDREYLSVFDAEQAAGLFSDRVKTAAEPPVPLFTADGIRLRSEVFTEAAWSTLEHAGDRAADLGYDRILPPHAFLSLLGETEGVAEYLVRLQAQPEVGPAKVAEVVGDAFRLGTRKAASIDLDRSGLGDSILQLLQAAQLAASIWGSERVDTVHIMAALISEMPARLGSLLGRAPLNFNLGKLNEHLEGYLRESRTQSPREVAFKLPVSILPSEDLTYRARAEGIMPALHLDQYIDPIERALYRRSHNHLLITGLRGVGKTTLVWEIARRAAAGQIPFLKRKRFLWINCADVGTHESKDKLTSVLSHVGGRTDLILCLDGIGTILRGESGANHKVVLRAALKEARVQVVGILNDWDFDDLLSADHELLEFFTRVKVVEPRMKEAGEIVAQAAAALQKDYKATIGPRAVDRAVTLSANFILSERLPIKAIKILRRVCEDLDYARTQKGSNDSEVSASAVVRVVSEISGVPEGTLLGTGERGDYVQDLSQKVIGQQAAVEAVAMELNLIKAGLTDPGKPASVMFFAGLTGVGKTELAKALAEFYSTSKKLQVYTMGNYTEAHSGSGIIGVPPGYVGHEQGGRLINDLNSDPYCVFLLDEAEKAHPDIYKPFLNLFDEGWVTDTRGVKAFADRAIFILTSNAGQETISDMASRKESQEKIVEEVRKELLKVRHERSNQPVFTPEFLARVKRVLIFRPLDEDAMEGICRKLVAANERAWEQKREKTIVVPTELIKYIAKKSHDEDRKSGFKEGGRVVRKMLSELVDSSIQREAGKSQKGYEEATRIELIFHPPGEALPYSPPPKPRVDVLFHKKAPESAAACMEEIAGELKRALDRGLPADELEQVLGNSANRLEQTGGGMADRIQLLRDARATLEERLQRNQQEVRATVTELIETLGMPVEVAR